MTWTAIATFLFTTPTGLSIVGTVVTLLAHGVGIQIPGVSKALNWIASKLAGGATPTPAPGPLPGPLPPIPTGFGQGQILQWALALAGMLLKAKQAGVALTPAEQAALSHVSVAADLHAPAAPTKAA